MLSISRVALLQSVVVVAAACGDSPAGASAAPDASPADDAGGGTGGGMVLIPAGPFMMGCNDAVDTQCMPDERPFHQVTLSAFEIDPTEVTLAEFAKCLAANVCAGSEAPTTNPVDWPIGYISWDVANAYCTWVGKRLPTEAEWEKAARGADGRKYPWGNTDPDCSHANTQGCGGRVVGVGSLPLGASPYGVLGMAGNVSEWVEDLYSAAYYANSPASDPVNTVGGGRDRALRGGDYASPGNLTRVSTRFAHPQGSGQSYTGIRCARSSP